MHTEPLGFKGLKHILVFFSRAGTLQSELPQLQKPQKYTIHSLKKTGKLPSFTVQTQLIKMAAEGRKQTTNMN